MRVLCYFCFCSASTRHQAKHDLFDVFYFNLIKHSVSPYFLLASLKVSTPASYKFISHMSINIGHFRLNIQLNCCFIRHNRIWSIALGRNDSQSFSLQVAFVLSCLGLSVLHRAWPCYPNPFLKRCKYTVAKFRFANKTCFIAEKTLLSWFLSIKIGLKHVVQHVFNMTLLQYFCNIFFDFP